MTSRDLSKRIITSIPLIFLLILSFYYFYILIITLIIVTSISWIEFNRLISKILKINLKIIFINLLSLIYLIIFSFFVTFGIHQENFKLNMIYLFLTCIFSDVGGLIFGKIFKGKKLTKISPKKTYSGMVGSYLLSLIISLILFNNYIGYETIIFMSLFVSSLTQIGDLFISFIKRKAHLKDTGVFLPGHGGLLDRFDGLIFAIPIGLMIVKFL